jgi:phytoene synthase
MNLSIHHENKAAFEHARLLTAHFSKSFYISAKMLPRERRWATYALYGFCRYVDNLVDNPRHRSTQELLAEAEFIMQELQIAYRSGESEHPILKPFIVVAKNYNIPIEYPQDLIRGVIMDIQNIRYKSFEDLYLFAYRVAGVVGLMMTYVLGYKDEAAFGYAEKLGIAMQLTNILRDIREDKNIGRIYLPLDELREFGVTESDIMHEHMTPALHKLMRFQVERAQKYYHEANPGIKLLIPESRFAIYSASKIYNGILHKIEHRDFNPFLGRVFVPQMKKISILLKEVVRSKLEVIQETLIPVPMKVANE